MNTYVLNGTNRVNPMNGTNSVVPMNGTNAVVPLNGTNSVVPMNGTNAVVPLNGDSFAYVPGYFENTDYVVPLNGVNGEEVYLHPMAFVDIDDVPLNGIPDYYTDQDIDNYRIAYAYGDADAMNGLFGKLKEKIQRAHEGNAAARQGRRERRADNREFRAKNKREGTRVIDKIGNAVGNVAEFLKNRNQAATDLEDLGVDYDPDVLDSRVAANTKIAPDNSGANAGGTSFFDMIWNNRTTGEKAVIALAGAGLGYGVIKSLNKGKGRKK